MGERLAAHGMGDVSLAHTRAAPRDLQYLAAIIGQWRMARTGRAATRRKAAVAAVCATHVYPVAGLQVCNTYIYIVIFCVSSSLQRVVPPGLSRATPVYPFSLCGGEHSDR